MSLPKGNKSCPHRKRQVLQSARFCASKQRNKQMRCNSGRTTLTFLRNNSKELGAQFRPELLLDGSKIRIQIKIKPTNRTRRGELHSRSKAHFSICAQSNYEVSDGAANAKSPLRRAGFC